MDNNSDGIDRFADYVDSVSTFLSNAYDEWNQRRGDIENYDDNKPDNDNDNNTNVNENVKDENNIINDTKSNDGCDDNKSENKNEKESDDNKSFCRKSDENNIDTNANDKKEEPDELEEDKCSENSKRSKKRKRVKKERCSNSKNRKKTKLDESKEYNFKKFPRYDEIRAHLLKLKETYPKKIDVVSIGKTINDRIIDMIIIKNDLNKEKHGALIDAGIHAREWLTITTVLYFIDNLVKDDSLLKMMDFYIIPCLNPDGYEYTHTSDRLWRKNLNPNGFEKVCQWGVDLNRNFPTNFGKRGSSGAPRRSTYRGKHALSEPETKALSDVMKQYEATLKLYISVHSYGNFIFYPWGFTKKNIEDRDVLDNCANAAKIAMYKYNKCWYRVGTAASQMYLVSGSSTDYATEQHNIKFSYCIELQKYGASGFQPKVKHIVPIGRETFEGLQSMVKFVYDYYHKKRRFSDPKMFICQG